MGILLGIFLLPTGIAQAHAVLYRSIPADGAVLDDPPTELQLWFSEPVEIRFSEVYLLDRTGKRVATVGALRSGSGDPTLVIAPIDPLPPGGYTVVWQVLSATDGHLTTGAFGFAVGRGQAPPGNLRPELPDIGASGLFTALGAMAKWLGYLSMAILVGGSAFFLLVWRGISGSGSSKPVRETRSAQISAGTETGISPSPLFKVLVAGLILTVLSTLLGAVAQSAINAGTGSTVALDSSVAAIGGTRLGILYGMRFLILALLAVPVLRGRAGLKRTEATPRWIWWICLGLGSLVLLLISLSGHAASGPSPLFDIFVDWLHIMAASVWAGGLAMLFLTLVQARQREGTHPVAAISPLVGRFSRLASICVAVLIFTGILRAVAEVGDWENLTDTAYGMALLIKLGFLVVLLGLAAVNLLLVGPRLATAGRSSGSQSANLPWHGRLRQTVGAEVIVVLAVLAFTSVLTSMQPGRDAFGPGFVVRGQGEDLRAVLVVKSENPEEKTLDVYLRDGEGRQITDADKVAFIFNTAGENRIEIETVADNLGDGHYFARGRYFSMIDKRNVQLLVRRNGREDARLVLDLSKVDSDSK